MGIQMGSRGFTMSFTDEFLKFTAGLFAILMICLIIGSCIGVTFFTAKVVFVVLKKLLLTILAWLL